MDKPRYYAATNHESFNCVRGPGNGLGYYAHTLNPDLSCNNKEEAERAASIANIAFEEGVKFAQTNLQQALGLKA